MIRIVIADDHSGIRHAVARLLNKQGDFTVVAEAENGKQAMELVESCQPDVLVLDVEMPEMSGIQVARELRTRADAPKIIILSSYSDQELVTALLGLGISGYMLKEDAPNHLPAAVRHVYYEGVKWLSIALLEHVDNESIEVD